MIKITNDITYYPSSNFDYKNIREYLDNINDWKTGTKSDGTEIKRLMKWYHNNEEFFDTNWKKRPERWKSCKYDNFLLSLQDKVQYWVDTHTEIPNIKINSLLINKYRNGDDYIKKHRDSVFSFGENPTIINMSIGCPRDIIFENIKTKKKTIFTLESKSILVMTKNSQKDFLHEIPRNKDQNDIRYSLTWREKI